MKIPYLKNLALIQCSCKEDIDEPAWLKMYIVANSIFKKILHYYNVVVKYV